MKLLNTFANKSFLMEKVGPYTLLNKELPVDRKTNKASWECSMLVREAVLLGTPKVSVLEASKSGRKLLEESFFKVKVDGTPVYGPVPLLAPHPKIPAVSSTFWFMGIEDDVPQGIFVSNGFMVEAEIECPRTIEDFPRIWISIDADLYRTI